MVRPWYPNLQLPGPLRSLVSPSYRSLYSRLSLAMDRYLLSRAHKGLVGSATPLSASLSVVGSISSFSSWSTSSSQSRGTLLLWVRRPLELLLRSPLGFRRNIVWKSKFLTRVICLREESYFRKSEEGSIWANFTRASLNFLIVLYCTVPYCTVMYCTVLY